jgi:hypothetical protein
MKIVRATQLCFLGCGEGGMLRSAVFGARMFIFTDTDPWWVK